VDVVVGRRGEDRARGWRDGFSSESSTQLVFPGSMPATAVEFAPYRAEDAGLARQSGRGDTGREAHLVERAVGASRPARPWTIVAADPRSASPSSRSKLPPAVARVVEEPDADLEAVPRGHDGFVDPDPDGRTRQSVRRGP